MLRHWKILAASLAVLVVAGIVALLVKPDGSGGPRSAAPCGLVAAYGGIFEVPSGVEVEVGEYNRGGLLERVLACVESGLSADAAGRYKTITGGLKGPDGSASGQAERIFVGIEIATNLAGTDAALQQRQVARRLVAGWLDPGDAIKRQGADAVLKYSPDVTHRGEVAAYQQGCRDAGVPVPGSFAADKTWIGPTPLGSETHRYFFRSDWNDSEAWTYKDKASGGFCVALVRGKSGKDEQYAGTICTNREQTNACFFDNVVYDGAGKKRIGWEEFRKRDFSELVHPKDGFDFCNNCHLGNNPYIVHPKTTLGQTVMSMYAAKVPESQVFDFVGLDKQPSPWTNFAMVASPGVGGCFDCHGIPEVTSGHDFCSGIIEMAANRTMPPGHWPDDALIGAPWFWPGDKGCFPEDLDEKLKPYFASLVKLKAICLGKAEETCPTN